MNHAPLDLAAVFIQTGELTDALDALNTHLAAVPDDDPARRLRSQVLQRLPDEAHWHAALSDLAALTSLTAADQVSRSVLLEKCSDLPGAVAAMHSALALQPGDERLTERLLHLLQAQGDFAGALAVLQTMPPTWRWRSLAGDVAAQAGQAQAAIQQYSEALALLMQTGQAMDSAWLNPLRARLLLARAGMYLAAGNLPQADADYAAAEPLIPADPMITWQRGIIALQTGTVPEAAAVDRCRAAYQSASAAVRQQMRNRLQEARVNDARLVPLADAIHHES